MVLYMNLNDCILNFLQDIKDVDSEYDENWVDNHIKFSKIIVNEWKSRKHDQRLLNQFYEELLDNLIRIINKPNHKDLYFKEKKTGKYLIDPFSLIYRLHAGNYNKVINITTLAGGKISVTLEEGSGQPGAPAQKSYFFRGNIDSKISSILWNFASKIMNYKNIDDVLNDLNNFVSLFQSVLSIPEVGLSKLTQALFYINPQVFCPYDGNAKKFYKVCKLFPSEREIVNDPKLYITEYLKKIHSLDFSKSASDITKKGYNLQNIPRYKTVWFSQFIYNYSHRSPIEDQKIDKLVNISKLENRAEDLKEFRGLKEKLYKKGQVILYGPPGTGKTYLAIKYIEVVSDSSHSRFITFHQSYSYEEFIEGLKPISNENKMSYIIADGIFKRLVIRAICEALSGEEDKAFDMAKISKELLAVLNEIENGKVNYYNRYIELKRRLWRLITEKNSNQIREFFKESPKFYLVIDEINRGDISRIFGELISLLEMDKRIAGENQIILTLPYSKEKLGVPPNLYIIGTMNTADRSIALIDAALRRRFGFIEIMPNYRVLIKELDIKTEEESTENKILNWKESELRDDIKKLAVKLLYILNQKISLIYDRDHQIGHSYFLRLKDSEDTTSETDLLEILWGIWYYEIIPLLQEYFYNDCEKLKYLLGDFVNEIELKKYADENIISEDEAKTCEFDVLHGNKFKDALIKIARS